ncbi:MAG: 23S rRNA (guanosine(2251)-2'-O)-methyltransferase RlmB [Bacillota bacterium]|nr:23S rRNA (guanosine(2251)-2'-O)-methyltransferase RlmB [Bacillota bacterium]
MPEIISGRNAVIEALKAGSTITQVYVADKCEPPFAAKISQLCRDHNVPLKRVPKQQLERMAGPDHRGVAAELAAAVYVELDDILQRAASAGQPPLLVMLDGVEDPHNLGAIIRTALSAGAHGLVIPKRRAASLNATVMKTSAGAAAYLPVARVANLNQAAAQLKAAGCWLVAADMDGQPLWETDMSGPLAIVLGGEGSGVSPLLKKNCDIIASIPMYGAVSSLNVSAAAAIMLYEAVRNR